jgi:hypothetical protein
MSRLDRLAPVKEIGQIGAAIGRDFSYSLLRAVAGRDETALKHATRPTRAGGTRVPPWRAAGSGLQLQARAGAGVAYENLLKSRRQVLHQRIAQTLRDRSRPMAEIQPESSLIISRRRASTNLAIEWWSRRVNRALDRFRQQRGDRAPRKGDRMAEGLAAGPTQRLLRLRLQTTYGHALLHGRGTANQRPLLRLRAPASLPRGIEDPAARFSAYYGMWLVSFVRADLAPMREVAAASASVTRNACRLASGGPGHARLWRNELVPRRLSRRADASGTGPRGL